jgi:hypothetical protein
MQPAQDARYETSTPFETAKSNDFMGNLPGLDLSNIERYAREKPLPALVGAAVLGYIFARTGIAATPVRATGLALSGTGDLVGGAVRGTGHLAGETIKGAGSLVGGVIGGVVPVAGGALSAGAHVAGGVLGAGKDVTVGTAKAGFKLGAAVLTLLPTLAALYVINAYAGQASEPPARDETTAY